MKKQSLKKNYIYNLIYQIIAIILPIITTPYLSRVLGAKGIGIYSYTLSIVTYFILIGALGTNMYAQREMACYQDDVEGRSKTFKELFYIRLCSFSITAIVFFLCFCISNEYDIYYRILLLEIFANMIDITWFYQGMENFKKVVVKNLLIKCISIFSIFIFIRSKNDVWIYVLIYVLSNLIGNLSLWLDLKKYLIKVKKINLKKHFRPMLSLIVPQIAMSIYNVLDKTMIGLLAKDISEVGYYEQSQKITRLAVTIVTALGTVMIPRISNVNSKGDTKKLLNYIYSSFNLVWFLSIPITFGLIVTADNFVPWFFGKEFEKVALLIKVCSPIAIFIGLANVMGQQYLVSTKRQNQYTYAVVASAIVNFFGNLILIPKYAAIGATISSVFAELVGVCVEIYFIRDVINIKSAFLLSKKYFIAAIIMLVGLMAIDSFFLSSMMSTAILVIIGITIYMLVLIILRDTFVITTLEKIINKIWRKKKVNE